MSGRLEQQVEPRERGERTQRVQAQGVARGPGQEGAEPRLVPRKREREQKCPQSGDKKTGRFWPLPPVPESLGPAWLGPGQPGHSLGFLQGVRFVAGQAHGILLRLLCCQ